MRSQIAITQKAYAVVVPNVCYVKISRFPVDIVVIDVIKMLAAGAQCSIGWTSSWSCSMFNVLIITSRWGLRRGRRSRAAWPTVIVVGRCCKGGSGRRAVLTALRKLRSWPGDGLSAVKLSRGIFPPYCQVGILYSYRFLRRRSQRGRQTGILNSYVGDPRR
jgi:hypothetical protein